MRFFNTAGPCDPARHYMIPAAPRLPEARPLIERWSYFVVHAPRQTGKTTTLRALARELTAAGPVAAMHFSCETGAAAGEDYGQAERIILEGARQQALIQLPPELQPPVSWPQVAAGQQVGAALSAWARACPRPLVLFFDEIDALTGPSLSSVLHQLRGGYADRPAAFPAAVVLCGMRDVRDYKAASGGDPTRLGTASPFNVKIESLRLGDFSADEVQALYAQHTADTGQVFTDEAVAHAFALTQGQPWLVNALAREIIEKLHVSPPAPITPAHLEQAKERLILARQTHLDSLVARLMEPRVRRVIAPLIAGALVNGETYDDDAQYLRDLGLIGLGRPVSIANPIYREVIVRVLAAAAEDNLDLPPRRFVGSDGRLDVRALLEAFAGFWREHGEVLTGAMPYHEVAPQLVLMAFLQRVVNGGGYVDREYGVGRGRIDVLVRWPYQVGARREWQREALELKVWAPGRPDPLGRGLEQLDEYLARLGLDAGVLVIFDRRPEAGPLCERTRFEVARTGAGREVTVLRG